MSTETCRLRLMSWTYRVARRFLRSFSRRAQVSLPHAPCTAPICAVQRLRPDAEAAEGTMQDWSCEEIVKSKEACIFCRTCVLPCHPRSVYSVSCQYADRDIGRWKGLDYTRVRVGVREYSGRRVQIRGSIYGAYVNYRSARRSRGGDARDPKRTLAGLPPLTSLVSPPPSRCHAAASCIDNIGISIANLRGYRLFRNRPEIDRVIGCGAA